MMTQEQIKELSKHYHIDEFSIRREYLQLLFLSHLYQHKMAGEFYFKGGTAIRLLYHSSRFSEDLDFTSIYDKKTIKKIITDVEKSMQYELPGLQIPLLYAGTKGVRYRIKYFTPDFKYPLVVRLDISGGKIFDAVETDAIISRFPISNFPIVVHLSQKEMFAEKIHALNGRNKGRDLYDAWYLFEKGVQYDQKLIKLKMEEDEEKFSKEKIINKVLDFPDKQLEQDLAQFLPQSQKKMIPMIKKQLYEHLSKWL